ncbi:MAG: TetR/AcrR family transcriptional regulator [Myxococcales bacterium]|nr:TetR/AcrR family transcriptional regulator [Myxococcales bacterium]
MVEPPEANARRVAILEAATGVFLRYGFKKTSMDDLARAAGLSRQGLYLHFPTKDALFKAAVQHLVDDSRSQARAALAGSGDEPVEARLLAAFEAMHGHMIGQPGGEHMAELLATTLQVLGPVYAEMEEGFIADVARTLRAAGLAAAWKDAGVSAKDLAEHLYAASCGVKHRVATAAEYREHMRVAVRIVCRRGQTGTT